MNRSREGESLQESECSLLVDPVSGRQRNKTNKPTSKTSKKVDKNSVKDKRRKPKPTQQPKKSRRDGRRSDSSSSSSSRDRLEGFVSPQEKLKMAANIDKFVKSLIDPDILIGQFPGNTYQTTVAKQQIVVSGNTYSADGDVNIYQSNDGLTPMCISNRAALAVGTGTAQSLTLVQPVSASAGSEPVVEPIQYGPNYVLFSHPVTFSNNATLPGYHFDVATAGLTVTMTTGIGMVGNFTWWHRAGAAYVGATSQIVASVSSYNFSIPTGSTAFGCTVEITQANGQPLYFTTPANPGSSLTFGNHASFTLRYSIPDRQAMSIERGRLLGNKVFLKYDGGVLNNGGGLAAAQFPPGTNPSQFPGNTTYSQILASGIPLLHSGHFRDGCVSRFIQPQASDYSLSSAPLRFGANGYTVLTGDPTPRLRNLTQSRARSMWSSRAI